MLSLETSKLISTIVWDSLPVIRIAIAESLCERITGDLELCDAMILVSRHGSEFGLREDEGAKVLRL